jgi:hypothetical protein
MFSPPGINLSVFGSPRKESGVSILYSWKSPVGFSGSSTQSIFCRVHCLRKKKHLENQGSKQKKTLKIRGSNCPMHFFLRIFLVLANGFLFSIRLRAKKETLKIRGSNCLSH